MSERFIKFILSEESSFLQKNYPNAFLLLCHIAQRARRISGKPDGLEIGEAFIGDFKEAGIETEMKYRTAKKILESRNHIQIIETCRTRKSMITPKFSQNSENSKKITTRITTSGTLVKLLSSDIWDINPKLDNDRCIDRITTEQRPDNDEQERKRMNKKEKEYIIALTDQKFYPKAQTKHNDNYQTLRNYKRNHLTSLAFLSICLRFILVF